jgi:hypothetical protein
MDGADSIGLFISYSRADLSIAYRLRDSLVGCGAEVWMDKTHITVGDSVPLKISGALAASDYLVLLMSKTSVESPWVQREWLPALMSEVDDRGIRILPARLDDCTIPAILRDKHYADFRTDYYEGLTKIVSAFAPDIRSTYRSRIAMSADIGTAHSLRLLRELLGFARQGRQLDVAPLLNTILYSGIEIAPADPPSWLVGRWRSLEGWNKGDIWTCTSRRHMTFSALAYGPATGHSLAKGCGPESFNGRH